MADNTLLLYEGKYIEWDWKIEKALRESLSEHVLEGDSTTTLMVV
jgi:hypothetical protein